MTTARFTVSDSAAARIKAILGAKIALRVAVDGGGCSGFQYSFALEDKQESDDLLFENSGAKVLIDPASLPFVEGSVLEFVDDLMGESFRVNNPKAKSSCGCGTSFAI
jgi:iron-sulfur cluster assembly accessory protein